MKPAMLRHSLSLRGEVAYELRSIRGIEIEAGPLSSSSDKEIHNHN